MVCVNRISYGPDLNLSSLEINYRYAFYRICLWALTALLASWILKIKWATYALDSEPVFTGRLDSTFLMKHETYWQNLFHLFLCKLTGHWKLSTYQDSYLLHDFSLSMWTFLISSCVLSQNTFPRFTQRPPNTWKSFWSLIALVNQASTALGTTAGENCDNSEVYAFSYL